MIKTNRPCQFTDVCGTCSCQPTCVSATKLTYGKRRFILSLRNNPIISKELQARFDEGTRKHNVYQNDIKTITEYGLANYRKDLFRHNAIRLKEVKVCVHPDTLIQTPYIPKKAKDLNTTSPCLDCMGEYNNITKKIVNNFDGDLILIKSLGNYDCLKCTPQHPILAIKTKPCLFKFKDKRFSSCLPTCSGLVNTCKNRKDQPFKTYTPLWVLAKDIKEGFLVVIPKTQLKTKLETVDLFDKDSIEYKRLQDYETFLKLIQPQKIRDLHGRWKTNKNSERSIAKRLGYNSPMIFRNVRGGEKNIRYMNLPQKLNITSNLMELLGLFVAEGNCSNNSVTFSFNINETDIIKRLQKNFKKIFKIEILSRIRKKQNSIDVRITNKVLNKFFKKWCYNGEGFKAQNKSFPKFYLNCNKEELSSMIKGYWLGDGTYANNCYSFSTVSETLTHQLREILSILNIYPSIQYIKNNDIILGKKRNVSKIYRINITGEQINTFEKIIGFKMSHNQFNFQKFYQDKSNFYIPITSVQKIPYTGEVINFSVDKNESFMANGIMTHNCSPRFGLHGILDVLSLQYDEHGNMNIFIDELKSNYSKTHYIQLSTYARILSDLNCKLVFEVPMVRKKKNKRMICSLYPGSTKYINIKGRIYVFGTKENDYWEIVANNQYFKASGDIAMFVSRRLKQYKEVMKQKVIDLEKIEYCNGCTKEKKTDSCGWRELCSRFPFELKTKQYHMGITKLIVKNRRYGRW